MVVLSCGRLFLKKEGHAEEDEDLKPYPGPRVFQGVAKQQGI